MTYLLIYLVLVLFAFAELSNLESKYKKLLYCISLFILMMLAGLRYETGGDWHNYTEVFDQIESLDQVFDGNDTFFHANGMEFGFKLLNSLSKFLVDNVQFLFFIVAVIIGTILFRSIPYYSPYPILSLLIYYGLLFFSLDMIFIRQGIAVAIVFYAYRHVLDQKFWKFLFLVLFASLFHMSSLVMIPVYFFLNRYYSTRILVVLFIIFNIVLLMQIRWLTPILEASLSLIVNPTLSYKIVAYITDDVYAVGRGLTFGFLVNLLTFILMVLNRNKMSENKFFNLFFNLFMFYLFIYCCMSELVEIGNRFKYFFMISFIVLFPIFLSVYKKLVNKVIVFLGFCLFAFVYGRNQFLEQPIASAFNPYQNYIIYSLTNKKSTGMKRLEKSMETYNNERTDGQ